MKAKLTNPRAKLERADEHLLELQTEARAFVETDPYSVINEERADDLDVAVLSVRAYPPLRLGLILGDVLANWRSALDNLANELVLLNGQGPGTATSFPIFSEQDDFARGRSGSKVSARSTRRSSKRYSPSITRPIRLFEHSSR